MSGRHTPGTVDVAPTLLPRRGEELVRRHGNLAAGHGPTPPPRSAEWRLHHRQQLSGEDGAGWHGAHAHHGHGQGAGLARRPRRSPGLGEDR
jgi:hypothetical protein